MKPYLLSLGVGLGVGVLYSLFGVRSPAPPVIALFGFLGILAGEQAVPVARRLIADEPTDHTLKGWPRHVFGRQPSRHFEPEQRP